eukprot:5339738-Pyramimonas_sp.AAC.1
MGSDEIHTLFVSGLPADVKGTHLARAIASYPSLGCDQVDVCTVWASRSAMYTLLRTSCCGLIAERRA